METKLIDFIINRKAGAVLRIGEEQVVSDLRRIFGERAGEFYLVDGDEIADTARNWLKAHPDGDRELAVGGGDGTFMTVASIMKGTGTTLRIIRLGTQGFLADNMGFSSDYREPPSQHINSKIRVLDMGNVNGLDFVVGLVLDKNSVKFFEAREALRENRFLSFLGKAFSFASGVLWSTKDSLIVAPGTRGEAKEHVGRIFAVTNNALAPRSSGGLRPTPDNFFRVAGNAFGKGEEPDGQLAFYGSKAGIMRAPAIFGSIWDGTWHESDHVTVVKSQELTITSPDKSRKSIRIVVDGELRDTELPLKITIQPRALRVYTPA